MTDENTLNAITLGIAALGLLGSVLAAFIAHKLGQAKNGWRLDAMEEKQKAHEAHAEKRFDEQDHQIQTLVKKTSDFEVNMGIIQTSLSGIKESLGRIESNLKDKQDK